MNVDIVKKNIENYCRSKGITVIDFFKKNNFPRLSGFNRMLKTDTIKFVIIEQLAEILDISIDDFVGRNTLVAITPSENLGVKDIYQQLTYCKNLIVEKDNVIKDKQKLIELLEKQIKHENK